MRVHLNLSIIASLVAASIGFQNIAYAKVKDVDVVGSEKSGVQVYVNTQQRSLYQIALLSGISVSELRQLNKGILDKTDIVKVGERIILPSSSPLFASEQGGRVLPALGNQNGQNTNDVDYQVASALKAIGQQDWNNMSSDKLKDNATARLQSETEGYVRNQVRNNIVNPVEAAAQNLLSKFGTAELNLSVSDEFSLRGSSLKLFSPWYDSSSTVIFSQMSIAEYDKRTIGNFGLGQRWDVNPSWLIGYNVFLDHDFSRSHNRLGVGLEAWTDYLRLSANYYYPLSDWKESKDFEDYLERAARGFDIRAQAYLPSYPHLGASLMFEKYYGDEVALFGKDRLQKDPSAVTFGVDYTPVPMFTIRGEHKQGSNSNTEAKVDFKMNYRIGVPLKDQLDPDKVAAARSLKGSRYDFVDRNNNIVLEYKDQRLLINLGAFPTPLNENQVYDLIVEGKARKAIENVSFAGSFDTAKYLSNSNVRSFEGWKLTTPPFVINGQKVAKHKLAMLVTSGGKTIRSNTIDIQIEKNDSRRPHLLATENGNTASLTAKLAYDNNGVTENFNDNEVFNKYPNNFSDKGALDLLNDYWIITDAVTGEKIILRDSCEGNQTGLCAVVKQVIKKKGENGAADEFGIVIEYEGKANVVLVLPEYPESNTVKIGSEVTGNADEIEVWIKKQGQDGFELVATTPGDKPWELDAKKHGDLLATGNTVMIKAFKNAAEGERVQITNPETAWSLTGDNKLACDGIVTDLTDGNDPAKRFEVGYGTQYTIPVKNAGSYAFKGRSLNNVTATPEACAGDQGFSLRVDVE